MSTNKMTDVMAEIPEDMEMIGPGKMLKQARERMGYSVTQVAERLNFRMALVESIECEEFDQSLPATYNRGYLKNYAKLVNVDEKEILDSYETLNIAKIQEAEMQSFSRSTEKQAANSRLMWLSYFILAVLVGLTVVWWVQSEGRSDFFTSVNQNDATPAINAPIETVVTEDHTTEQIVANEANKETNTLESSLPVNDAQQLATTITDDAVNTPEITDKAEIIAPTQAPTALDDVLLAPADETVQSISDDSSSTLDNVIEPTLHQPTDLVANVTAIFDFSGDCWVNIYDASGERIAWGVKKSGYVMTIQGQAPFSITLGKPELVSINYDGTDVEMSQFRQGQIAKFTLPVNP